MSTNKSGMGQSLLEQIQGASERADEAKSGDTSGAAATKREPPVGMNVGGVSTLGSVWDVFAAVPSTAPIEEDALAAMINRLQETDGANAKPPAETTADNKEAELKKLFAERETGEMTDTTSG